MTIETAFTPWMSLAGGALIGLAAVFLMATHGRVFGATGVLSGVIFPSDQRDRLWRLAVILGMMAGPFAYFLMTESLPQVQVTMDKPLLAVGGLLVGIGVTIGSGCTSGHGVCGMARLSVRSITATLTFMATTAATVFLIRHILEI